MKINSLFSADASKCASVDFSDYSYLALRPVVHVGEQTMDASLLDYDEVQVQVGLNGVPTHLYDTVADAAVAIDWILAQRNAFPHLRTWYNGLEIQAEFFDWRSLAAMYAEWDDDWEAVENVAAGIIANPFSLTCDGNINPVIAEAIKRVAR